MEVFSASLPERPYAEIGILTTRRAAQLGTAVAALREEAARRGCDGVVVGAPFESTTDFPDGSTTHATTWTAACIVYR